MVAGHVHLSKKDFGFFNNMQYIVKSNSRVTTNQNKLFDKLLTKYQRQLKKLGHNIEQLLELKWDVVVIDSAQEYLDATVYLEGDNIHIRSPFNTKFVTKFRGVPDNTFVWDKDKKVYQSTYSTYALKIAVNSVKEYFDTVNFSSECKNLLSVVDGYENYSWEPTLKRTNGFYYVSAINEHLCNAIKDIHLDDDPKTLYKLSQYGICISNEICDTPLKVFASSYFVTSDLTNIDKLIEWLKLLEVEHVFTAKEVLYNKVIHNMLKIKLLKEGITSNVIESTNHNGVLLKTMSSRAGTMDMKKIDKVIDLTNSTPVEIK
jgi:hypothetical protein